MNTGTDAYEYYFGCLDRGGRQVYCEIKKGIESRAARIRLPMMKYSAVHDIYSMVKYDHPEYFFCSYGTISVSGGVIIQSPEYGFGVSETKKALGGMLSSAEKLLSPVADADRGRQISFVHDYLAENVTYTSLYKNYSHEIYGVMNHGIGVCEGIAKTAKFFFDILGIPSCVAVSEANEKNTAHAWNVVLGKSPRHLDVTFDIGKPAGKKYYLVRDNEVFADHRPPRFTLPECV